MSLRQQRARGDELPQVFGRYLLVRRLSRGGMGEIFLARHGLSGFEKLCVIKKVLPNLVEDAQFISRFIDEAQVAIKLQHAHIAQVFEVGRVDDEYFLALEYVEGRDLRRTLSLLADREERYPVDLALLIARDVAAGLSYAHRRSNDSGESLRLVHCDISPPNIMVSFEGETKIIDFGIAKSVMRGTATDPRMGFGKFGYMAPEQLIRGGMVDFRTDIYAAGVILYELLVGQRLYEVGETPDYRALARMVAHGQHPLPSQVDPELAVYDDLVARALRPKPEDRWQSAAEFRDAIQHALVTVNPTASQEALGSFMRGLFAAEVAEQRRLAAEAEATDINPWVEQLTTQSATTVSYALAHMPLLAPSTQMVERPLPPPVGSQRRRRTPLIAAVVAAVLLVAGAALAWKLSGDETGGEAPAIAAAPQPVPGPAPQVAVAPLDSRAPAEADVMEMPPMELARPAPAEVEPAGARPPVHRGQRPAHRPASRPAEVKPPAEPTVSRDSVQTRFRALAADYKQFKASYGPRLEGEFADLAHFATFDAKGDDALRELDRRITSFRARMRKEQQ